MNRDRNRVTLCPDCSTTLDDTRGEETSGEWYCPECGANYTEDCQLCERHIELTYAPAICDRCAGACRAHARLATTVREDIREGWTDERGRAR